MSSIKYFRLNSALNDDTVMVDIASHEEYYFTLGLMFEDKVPEPVEFVIDEDLSGNSWPTLMAAQPLIKINFLNHLKDLGVTNIHDYAARIVRESTIEVNLEYRAINIIGSVFCANLKKSQFTQLEGMYFFDRLVIDPNKVPTSSELFRLGEAAESIVISKNLADQIDLKRFSDILLSPIETSN